MHTFLIEKTSYDYFGTKNKPFNSAVYSQHNYLEFDDLISYL